MKYVLALLSARRCDRCWGHSDVLYPHSCGETGRNREEEISEVMSDPDPRSEGLGGHLGPGYSNRGSGKTLLSWDIRA